MSNKRKGAKRLSGECIVCGAWVDEEPEHHLLNRGAGGSSKEIPTVPCHMVCHDYLHRNTAEAYAEGWLIRRFSEEGRAILGED